MMFALIDLIVVTVALEALTTAAACPTECVCKWKNGKQSVDCAQKGLTFLPIGLDSGTQVLDFSGNNLQVLQKEAFYKIGLVNLQKIYMQHCRLHKIDNFAFKGLTNLVELDISQNYLTIIPSANFIFIPVLMRLILNDNPITTIKSQTFQHLMYLTTLEISNCKIEFIENEAFSSLNHLEWLKLDGNKLTTIRGDSILPENLRGVDLNNNQWNCDCQLIDLHTWLRNFNLPHSVEPICSKPLRLAGQTITSLNELDLACLPEITPTYLYIELNEGKNITIECKVTALPEAKISWWFEGQILHNNSIVSPGYRLIFLDENGTIDKKSKLFIFNSNVEDNGTFSCMAENPAGRTIANYTIKIIIENEPTVVVLTFPYKYSIILICGGLIIFVLLLTIIVVAIVSCKVDSKRRKKRESGKDVALQVHNTSTKSRNSNASNSVLPAKSNGSLIANGHSHHAIQYSMNVPREFVVNLSEGQRFSPNSVMKYVEKNPDIVHDAENVNKNRIDGEGLAIGFDNVNTITKSINETVALPANVSRQVKWKDQSGQEIMPILPRPINKNLVYHHCVDVHLNPGCFLETDGYPPDYGLPKLKIHQNFSRIPNTTASYYQTLPHNRSKIRKLTQQYAKDNEFNSVPCPNYEHFNPTDTRYTVEGYPFSRTVPRITFQQNPDTTYQDQNFVPSPPEGYKSESTGKYCGVPSNTSSDLTWTSIVGHHTSANVSILQPPATEIVLNTNCNHIETRCANTQTSETDVRLPCDGGEKTCNKASSTTTSAAALQLANIRPELETCTESPDEGYVGDGVIDNTDM